MSIRNLSNVKYAQKLSKSTLSKLISDLDKKFAGECLKWWFEKTPLRMPEVTANL